MQRISNTKPAVQDQSRLRLCYTKAIALFMLLSCMSICHANDVVQSSDFFITDPQGNVSQALTLSAKVDIEVNGLISHTNIKQRFLNNSSDFVEGEYVFPLPDTASIDSMQIKIGSRIIKGQLKEKEQAKKIYKKAQAAGKRAALMTQDRPNLFRMKVTNIPAGEVIEVTMSYVNNIDFDNGKYSLMFPMTLTPRFNPLHTLLNNDITNVLKNPDFIINNLVADEIINPLELTLKLNPGFSASNVMSSSHKINIDNPFSEQQHITFSNRFEPMDSDFHLIWQQNNRQLEPGLFIESLNDKGIAETGGKDPDDIDSQATEHYAMLMLTPAAPDYQQYVLNKEIVFIIDTSGSMGGASIRQAKAALQRAIKMMNAGDSFNIIEFNSRHRSLFPHPQDVSDTTLQQADYFISRLYATGGTNMKPAIIQALTSPVDDQERMRQVIFITDGAVGNENDLMQSIQQHLGDSRLFSVAIGSSPNQHLFRQASKYGKGTFIKISKLQEVSEKMNHLFAKVSKPAMKNIELIDNNGNVLAVEPESIPDVYYGEPVKVVLKLKQLTGDITIQGTLAGNQFHQVLSLENNKNSKGIAKLWARAKIESLTDKMLLGRGDTDKLKKDIIDLSLKHHVLTAYTSFIAVDQEVVRNPGEALKKSNVKNLIPKGTQFPKTSLDILPLYALSFITLLLGCLLRLRGRHL